ncbi:MAG: LemA family protein [Oscillospiraceae bacterium]|nr:LemA family protein [Oscillospiraceae bacterium]
MPYLLLALVLVLSIVFISSHNELVLLRNRADEAFSQLDVYLKTRSTLAVDAAKLAKPFFEKESSDVLAFANAKDKSVDLNRLDREESLRLALGKLFIACEGSELKENAEFCALSERLESLDLSLKEAVRFYDSAARAYNIKVESFPASLVASLCKFERKPVF